MLLLALKNLLASKTRLAIAIGGIGFALTLVLFFDAVFAGATDRLTLYIDNAGADVWVSQEGVRTMHMSVSAIPVSTTEEVRKVGGVEDAIPVLYVSDLIGAGDSEYLSYVFGVAPGSPFGGPWTLAAGKAQPDRGEIVLDKTIADEAGLGLGDSVRALGQEKTIVGLTRGTTSLVNAVAFANPADFAAMSLNGLVISFVLVRVQDGIAPEAVAGRIDEQIPGVTAQTRKQFAHEERKLVKDMSTDVINIMNLTGFVVGLAIVALTIYTATLARRSEYGVLKAIGMRNRQLYATVLVQALFSVLAGMVVAVLLTFLLSIVIPWFRPAIVLTMTPSSLARTGLVSLFIAGAGAVIPIRQIAHLDPALVYRR